MDYSKQKYQIQELILKSKAEIQNYVVLLVNNQQQESVNILSENYLEQISVSDLSSANLLDIENGFRIASEHYRFYHSSAEFIGSLLLNELPSDKQLLIYTTTHIDNSVSGRSFLPLLANKHNCISLSGNPYTLAITKNKKDYFKLLVDEVPIPTTYENKDLKKITQNDFPLIVKPSLECCAKNVSIVYSKKELEQATIEITKELQQPVVIQKYIPGIEINVPILYTHGEYIPMPPTIIFSEDPEQSILTEETIKKQTYSYQVPSEEDYPLRDKQIEELHNFAVVIAKRLNLEGLSRIDFRMNKDGIPIVFDIASIPYLTPYDACHRSFAHLFPNDNAAMFKAIIGAVL
ncbi:ATP-grasp domain-containing protein [Erwinia sp. CPCC 100877]|nr:ATP-grasp domain-containing protein [Erwinia sp. CPCC 100877]